MSFFSHHIMIAFQHNISLYHFIIRYHHFISHSSSTPFHSIFHIISLHFFSLNFISLHPIFHVISLDFISIMFLSSAQLDWVLLWCILNVQSSHYTVQSELEVFISWNVKKLKELYCWVTNGDAGRRHHFLLFQRVQ